MSRPGRIEAVLRAEGPRALGALIRRSSRFDLAEDAMQEAMLVAAERWGRDGVPEHPRGWLIEVAARKQLDALRRESARRRREELVVGAEASDPSAVVDEDDSLALLFLCCHPAVAPPAQLALTLRAVAGLTTAEIARAFLLSEATVAQRISRAKRRIREAGAHFVLPDQEEWEARLGVVRQVLYLLFNEGYVAGAGPELVRAELSDEAIRLTRELAARLPEDGEVAGLLALMLLTDARRATRTTPEGALVALADQDRGRWDAARIAEGVALVSGALASRPLGPYQLQAAIAAVHAEAPSAEATDWPQVLALYELLEAFGANPVVRLNRAVATGMVHGPYSGLAVLDALAADPRIAAHHRLAAVRGHLLELAGERRAAREAFLAAGHRAESRPEQRFLAARAAALG